MRTPADLLRRVRIVGEEHLRRAGGAILLGFHVGPPVVGEALCAAGYHVWLFAGARHSRSWSSPAWAPIREQAEGFSLHETATALGGMLYRARRRLLGGDAIYIAADGGRGKTAFALSIPDALPLAIKSGWLALRRDCSVPVLPVVAYIEGSMQVITIHPPLPVVDPDGQRDIALCRNALTTLLADYARDHPEQCSALVFED